MQDEEWKGLSTSKDREVLRGSTLNRDIVAMLAFWRREPKRNDWAMGLRSITPKILIITVTLEGLYSNLLGMDPMMGVEILGLEEEFTSATGC